MGIHRIVKGGWALAGTALILGSVAFGQSAATTGSAKQTEERMAQIRARWADVQARIDRAYKEAESGSPAGFYSTEIMINANNGSWRGSGTYHKNSVFWYTDQPEFAGRESDGPASVLLRVEIQEIVGPRTFHRVFMFDKGKLVFYFAQDPDVPGEAGERRYYFSDGALFRYMEGQKVISAKPDIRAIQAEAKSLQALFLATF